jgi:hypothetical protein
VLTKTSINLFSIMEITTFFIPAGTIAPAKPRKMVGLSGVEIMLR